MSLASQPPLWPAVLPTGRSLAVEDEDQQPSAKLPEEEEPITGSLHDLLEDAYDLHRRKFRKILISKPKLYIFQFLYCIKALLAPLCLPTSLFNCYADQIFQFNISLYDNAFAKVAIFKRVAHFEPAQDPVIPESDINDFINAALRDLELLQQQLADTTEPR